MGLLFSSMKDWFNGEHNCRILMAGLYNAGKTAILYKLALGEMIHTTPTIGFNVETVSYRNVSFDVWDVGNRVMRHHYFSNSQAIIFVVDSTDYQRFTEAKNELQALLRDEVLREAKLLIFCNKSDLPMSKHPEIMANELGINVLIDREWTIQSCSAKTGDGLVEGLEKLYLSLTGKRTMNGEIN